MSSGTLELLGQELSKALHPLKERLTAGEIRTLLAELGLQFPATLEAQAGFINALTTVAESAAGLAPLAADLAEAIENDDTGAMIQKTLQIIDVLRVLLPALDTIGTTLNALSGSFPEIPPAEVSAFAAELPRKLLDFILVTYLEGYYSTVLQFLSLFGITELVDEPGDPADETKPPHTRRTLRLERIGELFSSPDTLLRTLYGWGDPSFDGRVLLERLHGLLTSVSIPVSFDASATPPALHLFNFRISPRVDLSPPALEEAFELDVPAGISGSIPILEPHLRLEVELEAPLAAQTSLLLQPPAQVTFIPPSGTVQGRASLGVARLPKEGSNSIVIVGVPGGSGLQAQRLAFALAAGFAWDSANGKAVGDFGFDGEIKGGKLIVTLEGADGFIGELLAGFGLEADFDLGFGWRAGGGVYFTGSSVLEIQLPLHIALGPVDISAITLSVGIENRAFPIGLAANIQAMLGPIQAVVEQIGVQANLTFPSDGKGQLGPVDFNLGFKPPKGVGSRSTRGS